MLLAGTSNIMTLEQFSKLTASTPGSGDRFGYSVAVSGDVVVVGAYHNDHAANNSGIAYIYTYDSSSKTYIQSARLTASDAGADDYFGYNVAINGDTVVVGAYGDIDNGLVSGSAYVFVKPQGGWSSKTEDAKLTASDANSFERVGYSVAVSGDTVVVGGYFDNEHGVDSGAAYIYNKPEAGWSSKTEDAKLTASDAAEYDYFAISVAISGDTVVVGSIYDDTDINNSGSAYVFVRPDGGWSSGHEDAKLTASDAAVYDYFGVSVAIDGDTIVVGASSDEDQGDFTGSAYLFIKPEGGWSSGHENAKLTASDGGYDHGFGGSVAISGDTLVIGALGRDNATGAAYLFTRPVSGWHSGTEDLRITASDGADNDCFGISVSISGTTVAAGAPYDDDRIGDSGSAYVYRTKEPVIIPALLYLLQ